jgi:hypothetical protein
MRSACDMAPGHAKPPNRRHGETDGNLAGHAASWNKFRSSTDGPLVLGRQHFSVVAGRPSESVLFHQAGSILP